jgi:hypothetical protein
MNPGDKVMLCVPEPYWEKYIKYQGVTDTYEEKEKSIEALDRYFAKKGVEVRAFIAGDLHHYRRFEDKTGVQKVTAGGGGAFLHPTHDFDFKKAESTSEHKAGFKGFSLAAEYPEYKDSRKMGWRDLGFLFHNRTFGIVTAVMYLILALLVRGKVVGEELRWDDNAFWFRAAKMTVDRIGEEPLVLLVILLLWTGLIFFTDSTSTIYKRLAGGVHGLAHLSAAFALGWLGYLISLWISAQWGVPVPPTPSTRHNLIWFGSVAMVSGLGGYLAGSFIMGAYLYISLRVFGRHSNEAFSALKIEDYKNFLRMHIDPKGQLTIYPIKIETVPKGWETKAPGDNGYVIPKDGTPPELIESAPVVVR